jgi:hypothetical protein
VKRPAPSSERSQVGPTKDLERPVRQMLVG